MRKQKELVRRAPTDGARALRRYLDDEGKSVPVFCEEHDLDRIQVQRAMNGERRRISVDFAHAIERATANSVEWWRWLSRTGRADAAPASAGKLKKAG